MAGRPRGVDDAVILRAAADVMGRVGPAGLTLAAVANEVGLVAGTLVQRFKSKRGLLVALAKQTAHDAETLHERVRRTEHESPLAALATLVVESMDPMATPKSFANHLAFLCMDLADAQLREYALAIHHARQRTIEALLNEAVSAGELQAGTNAATLAGSIQAIIAGAGVIWALDRQGTLPQRLLHELHTILSPHGPSCDGPTPEES